MDPAALSIEVASLPCDVSLLTTTNVRCRLQSRPAATVPARPTPTNGLGNGLGSFASERGVRWQWSTPAVEGSTSGGSMLLSSFSVPTDCSFGCGPGWRELRSPTMQIVEGWFEAPVSASVIFMLRTDAASTLTWSGNESTTPAETLAYVDGDQIDLSATAPVTLEVRAHLTYYRCSAETWCTSHVNSLTLPGVESASLDL